MEQSINLHGIQLLEHIFTDLDYADDVTIMEESLSNLAKSLGQLQMDSSQEYASRGQRQNYEILVL